MGVPRVQPEEQRPCWEMAVAFVKSSAWDPGFSLSLSVTECKFMCLMHSEAKQTEMSEFRAEKEPSSEKGWLLPPEAPNSLQGFSKAFFLGWGESHHAVCRIPDQRSNPGRGSESTKS